MLICFTVLLVAHRACCLLPHFCPSRPFICNTLRPNSYMAFTTQLKRPCIPQNLFFFFRLEAASLVSGPPYKQIPGKGKDCAITSRPLCSE